MEERESVWSWQETPALRRISSPPGVMAESGAIVEGRMVKRGVMGGERRGLEWRSRC